LADQQQEYRQFIVQNALKGVLWLAGIVALYLLADYCLPAEWDILMTHFNNRPLMMVGIFFASETLFGLIPLELFILMVKHEPLWYYSLYVGLLAVLSYAGGIIAFWAGRYTHRIPLLKRLTQTETFLKYEKIYRKWGGIVIVLAALTPLPYSTISFLSSSLHFPFKRYLLYAATRFLRFAVVGTLIKLGYHLF